MEDKISHQKNVLRYWESMITNRGLDSNPDVLGRTTSQILGPEFLNDLQRVNTEIEHPVIVECGSGMGKTLLGIKKLYPKAKLIGFDLKPDLSLNAQGIKVQEVDVENLLEQQDLVKSGSADLVFSCASYRYFYDKLKFLTEVFALLKVGGQAHIDIGSKEGLVKPSLGQLIKDLSLNDNMKLIVNQDDFGHKNFLLRINKIAQSGLDWGVSFVEAVPEKNYQKSPVKISVYK